MVHITLEIARKYAAEAIEERGGDYVYVNEEKARLGHKYDGPNCLYVHRDADDNLTPGCIVGIVLNKAGVSLETLASNNENTISEAASRGQWDVTYDNDALMFLSGAQWCQDMGETWSTAVESGNRQVALLP